MVVQLPHVRGPQSKAGRLRTEVFQKENEENEYARVRAQAPRPPLNFCSQVEAETVMTSEVNRIGHVDAQCGNRGFRTFMALALSSAQQSRSRGQRLCFVGEAHHAILGTWSAIVSIAVSFSSDTFTSRTGFNLRIAC